MRAWERHVLAFVQYGPTHKKSTEAVRILRKSYVKVFCDWYETWVTWHLAEFREFRRLSFKVPGQNKHRRRWLHTRINAAYSQHGRLAERMELLRNKVYYSKDQHGYNAIPFRMAYLRGYC
jgi:hypothetical protein